MLDINLIQQFLVALVLGALIGLEREYAHYRGKGQSYAGIRTYPLIALFGALSAYLGELISPWILLIGMVLVGGLILIAYFNMNEHVHKYVGATSEVAGFITFFIGVVVYYNQTLLATVLAIAMTIILYARSVLHNFARKMEKKELADTLKFVVIAFVILPFLPNKGYGPFEVFNPYQVWLMVVFISAISFVGYILLKWFGEKGITLAGFLGGVASSTATTLSFSERSKKETRIFRALALAVILANVAMFGRILVLIAAVNIHVFWQILPSILILLVLTGIFSYYLWKKARKVKSKITLSSPFTLWPALKFGLLFAVIVALTKVANVYLSTRGIYLVSFFSGFVDVDPIVLSLGQLAKTAISEKVAHDGILIAMLTNILAKGGLAYWMGGRAFGKIVLSFFLVLTLIGIGLLYLF
ncbi:MgtC/SapB family protein [Candidatus Woesearchaeota archaeon]|nr:MgtC/SapB family protein [Candidatus Woesearchaeota archaeon]